MSKYFKKILLAIVSLFSIISFIIPIQAEEISFPDITSEYAYLYDLETGQAFYDKQSEEMIYPASMTKIMTGILAIENLSLDDTVLITSEMYSSFQGIDASVAGFSIGEEPTVEDLLYGLLLPSGADSACVLAYAASGSIESFVKLMNEKAKDLELTRTHFTNPTGLHNLDQYSSCKDIAMLLAYAVQDDTFQTILDTSSYTTSSLLYHPSGITFTTHISDLLKSIPGFVGGKTGYTPDAGRCLASYAMINGMPVVLVTAKASTSIEAQNDAYTIYSYLNETYARQTLLSINEYIKTIAITGGKTIHSIDITSPSSCIGDVPIHETIYVENNLPDTLVAPIEEGTEIGTVTVRSDSETYCTSVIYVEEMIEESIPSYVLKLLKKYYSLIMISIGILLFLLFCIAFRIHTINKRKKRRRKKR